MPHTPQPQVHDTPRPTKRAVTRRKSVRRIPLKSLEALSNGEVEAANRLLRLLPAPVPGERLLDELADEAERLVGLSHDIFYHSVRTYAGSEFSARLDEHFTTTFNLAPDPDLGVLAADMNLVGGWLEELLEDEPPEARTLPPPSARDFGLVTFVLMQLLNWLCQRGLPPLSIPSSAPDLETIAKKLRRHTEIAEVVYAVTTPTSAGLVRLFVPVDMTRNLEVFVSESKRRNRHKRRLMLSRLGSLRAHLPLMAANLRLTPEEVDGLRPGDMVLPPSHGLSIDGVDDGGQQSQLWLDTNGTTYLPCRVRANSATRWEIEITDAAPVSADSGEQTTQRDDHGDEMSESQPNKIENDTGQGATRPNRLLENAQVDVQVRVGQMPLPMSMLAQVQSGYVLELERRVEDGVDLVVDGRVIGNGELVNVEGRLGVRILSIED